MAKAQIPPVDVKIKIIGTASPAKLIKKIFRTYLPKDKILNEKSSIESYISLVEYAEERAKQDGITTLMQPNDLTTIQSPQNYGTGIWYGC